MINSESVQIYKQSQHEVTVQLMHMTVNEQ